MNANLSLLFYKSITIFIALFGMGAVVFIHECGHFFFAKLFGIRTPTFSIGMGPALFSFKLKGTTFQLSAIPAGGYCEIEFDEENRNSPGNFHSVSYPKRLAILLGGILFNVLGAFAAYTAIDYVVGLPSNKISSITIASIKDNSLASSILFPGNIILGINEKTFEKKGMTQDKFFNEIIKSKGSTLSLLIKKENEEESWIKIEVPASDKTQGILGAMLQTEMKKNHNSKNKPKNIFHSIKKSATTTIEQLKMISHGTLGIFKAKSIDGISGPVMTIAEGFKRAENGVLGFLLFLSFISLSLAVINIFPFGIFDGGRVFTMTIEAIVGRPLTLISNIINMSSALILMFLFFLISIKEIKVLVLSFLK